MSFFLETRVVPLLCWWHTGSAGTCWPKKPSRLCGKPPQGCEPLDASYIFPNPLIQNNSRALIPHILWFTSPFVFTSYQPSISQRCFKFSHNTRFKGKQPSSVVSLSQQDIYRINILLSSYCCYTKWSHKQEPKYRPRQTWPEKGLIFHKKGKEAIGEQRAGEHGWSKQQQTGSCKNRKTRQRCRRYKKNPHKKGRLSNTLPQKILKKEEPGVTMEDLQQSGNDMWNKPLFTAADPIDPNELQVSEVVLQRCLPGKKEQEETNKPNRQILSFCSDEMKITFHEITSIKS